MYIMCMLILNHQSNLTNDRGDMSEEKFKDAADRVQNLPSKPGNDTLLELYSLYKQGTDGDVSGKRPGFADFAGRAKYDAWAKLQGTSKEDAQEKYIALVDQLEANGA